MMDTRPIVVHLSVEVNEGDVIADVLFSNTSSDKIYLDEWTICTDNIFRRNIFSITGENSIHAPYTGMIVNRRILPDDFIELNPGESIKTKITVNNGYKLIKGHTYKIFFCVSNPTLEGKQPRLELMSNKVEIMY